MYNQQIKVDTFPNISIVNKRKNAD